MADALRNGKIGVMDYLNMKNINADTDMRDSFSKQNDPKNDRKE